MPDSTRQSNKTHQVYEERLTAMHQLTRDLLELHSPIEVAEQAAQTAADLLDVPVAAIYEYNKQTDTFTALATADRNDFFAGSFPVLSREEFEPLFEQYNNNETKLYHQIDLIDQASSKDFETIVCVPLEDVGFFFLATTERKLSQDDDEEQLIDILSGNVRVAVERAEREQQLETYQEELETAVEQLEASNQELEQFAYVASHDLQEPLRMVSSYLSLLEMEMGDELDDETQEYIDYAVDGAERMKKLIDDLLKYSRVETQEREFVPHELNTTLEAVRQDLTFLLDEKDGELLVKDLPEIHADESQMKQLFQNLVANALKYSHPDRPPEVVVYADEQTQSTDHVRIHVQDNGCGISESQQERIFEVFTRGELSDDEDDGTGIGLAVCKRIVEGHNGELTVSSTEGEGTTFSFTLATNPEKN